ncbi:peptidoglycan DD-metalloendopeptidase family protein [Deinococcus sp. DB0503]|uniref:peptidoglycan DD-metalloendopeptidase family protein n=1 Tax=Deinococcus sp. DB0503 TaxID=2479203 RepID=UPI00351C48CB
MPESRIRPAWGLMFPFRRLTRTLALCSLSLIFASPAAARPAPEELAALLGVPTPAARLTAALPAVQLTRVPAAPSLLVVTPQPAAQVAARYGVPVTAVDPLPPEAGAQARVLRVRLPVPEPGRPPVLPRSVQVHTARPGETLATVAARYGLSVLELLSANLDRTSLDDLAPGETLFVPTAERGLLVRLKPGQTALAVIAGYRADLIRTARANDVLPTALQPGDYLLLPGVQAKSRYAELLERRAARQEAERRARVQAQYQRYLAWQRERERERLQALYDRQAQYEAYLAWKSSPERQRRVAEYARQEQFAAARARPQAAGSPSVRPAGVSGGSLVWPLRRYRITSRYGEADIDFHKQVFHGGVDLAAPAGTPVYAAAAGLVTESGYGAYGMNVYTVQGNSTLVYGHLSRTAVTAGQTVQPGDLIGEVGCTGICTGPHLHFEIRLAGQTVDPLVLLP